jgi:hypothetical protein
MKWLLEEYRTRNRLHSLKEIAEMAGIDYQRLLKRIENPKSFKLFEIEALDELLHFTDSDLLKILRGEF